MRRCSCQSAPSLICIPTHNVSRVLQADRMLQHRTTMLRTATGFFFEIRSLWKMAASEVQLQLLSTCPQSAAGDGLPEHLNSDHSAGSAQIIWVPLANVPHFGPAARYRCPFSTRFDARIYHRCGARTYTRSARRTRECASGKCSFVYVSSQPR